MSQADDPLGLLSVSEKPNPDPLRLLTENDHPVIHDILNTIRVTGSSLGQWIEKGLADISLRNAANLNKPQTALQIAKGGTFSPEQKTELTVLNRKSEDYWIQQAKQADAESAVDPKLADHWNTQIASAAGPAIGMGMESLIPIVGVPLMAAHAGAAAEIDAKLSGKNDKEQEEAGTRALIGAAIFGASNKAAALGVAKLLPNASKLTKFLTQFGGQEVANEVSSRAINAWEAAVNAPAGQKTASAMGAFASTNIGQEVLNAVYAGIGASHEAGRVVPETGFGLKDVTTQGGETDAKEPDSTTGPIPTEQRKPVVSKTESEVQAGDPRQTPAPQQTPVTAVPSEQPIDPHQSKLPAGLKGAKPTYGYRDKQFTLNFESDFDKAAYITAQTVKSKADQAYMDFAKQVSGLTDTQIRQHGKDVRAAIKAQAKDAEPGQLIVTQHPIAISKPAAVSGTARPPAAAPTETPSQAKQRFFDAGNKLKEQGGDPIPIVEALADQMGEQQPSWSQMADAIEGHLKSEESKPEKNAEVEAIRERARVQSSRGNKGSASRLNAIADAMEKETDTHFFPESGNAPPEPPKKPPTQKDFEDASESNDKPKMREHINTIKRMKQVGQGIKDAVSSWFYPITNAETNARANSHIDQRGIDNAYTDYLLTKDRNHDEVSLGHNLALRLEQLGRADEATVVRNTMAERATDAARVMQYIASIAKTSPEGLIRAAKKIVAGQIKGDPQKVAWLKELDRLHAEIAGAGEPKLKQAKIDLLLNQLGKINARGQRLSPELIESLRQQNKAGTLTADDFHNAIAKHLGLPFLSKYAIAKIREAQEAWNKTPDSDGIKKLQRGADMMDAVYSLVPAKFLEKVRGAAMISMIFHGRLPVRIGVSNAIRMFGQTAVDAIKNVWVGTGNVVMGRPGANPFTITAKQWGAMASGFFEPWRAFKAGWEDARARQLSILPSFKEGARTLIDMSNLMTRGLENFEDIHRAKHLFSSRFGKMMEDAVTVLHNTVPYGFWSAAYRGSMARQMAIRGLDVPTEEISNTAMAEANAAIFRNPTAIGHMVHEIASALNLKGKYGVGTATAPFTTIPGAILTEGATWTPVGYVRALYEMAKKTKLVSGEFNADHVADAVIKATLGTIGPAFGGYWLHHLGVLTGAPEENKELEAFRQSLKWGAYRVNVSSIKRRIMSGDWWSKESLPQDGDLVMNYNWIEPVAISVAMGASVHHSVEKGELDMKRGKISGNAFVDATAAAFGSLASSPFLTNVERLASDLTQRGIGQAALGALFNIPGNFVPSLARQTMQKIDNTVRETRGGGLVEQEWNRLESQIPGLSKKFPARYDVFGDAVKRYDYGTNTVLNVFFNPAQFNRFKANPGVREMMALYERTGETKGETLEVAKKITVDGKEMRLDNQQLATYQRYVGALGSAAITRLLASPNFARLTDKMKQGWMVEIMAGVHKAAKEDLFGEKPQLSLGARGIRVEERPTVLSVKERQQAQQGFTQLVPFGGE